VRVSDSRTETAEAHVRRHVSGVDVDRAFLRWLEARLAVEDPETAEDALDYLVAIALHDRSR